MEEPLPTANMKKVTLCSKVLLGTDNIEFIRQTFKYDTTKAIHPPIPNSLNESEENETMIIDMPLEDPASYLS